MLISNISLASKWWNTFILSCPRYSTWHNEAIRENFTLKEILGNPSVMEAVRENWIITSAVNSSIAETILKELAYQIDKPEQHGDTDIWCSISYHTVNFLESL